VIVEIVHFYFYFGNGNGVNQTNGYDFAFEWFTRILRALRVFYTVEILLECFWPFTSPNSSVPVL